MSKRMDNCTFVENSSAELSDANPNVVNSDVNGDSKTKQDNANDPAEDDKDNVRPKIESCVGQNLHAMLAKLCKATKILS